MTVQIDRMDTSVEIMSPAAPANAAAAERRAAAASDPQAQAALRDVVGAIMAEELDRFMRNRGM